MKVVIENPHQFYYPRYICTQIKKRAETMGIKQDIYVTKTDGVAAARSSLMRSRANLQLPSNFPEDALHFPEEFTLHHELSHIQHRDTRSTVMVIFGIMLLALYAIHQTSSIMGVFGFVIRISVLVLQIVFTRIAAFYNARIFERRADKDACKYLSIREKIATAQSWVLCKVAENNLFEKNPWWSLRGMQVRWEAMTDEHPRSDERIKIIEESFENLSAIRYLYAKWIFSFSIGFFGTFTLQGLWKSWEYLVCSKKIIRLESLETYYYGITHQTLSWKISNFASAIFVFAGVLGVCFILRPHLESILKARCAPNP
jgi:hypothetical protein